MICDKVDITVNEIYEIDSNIGFKRRGGAIGKKSPVVEVFKTPNQSSPSLMQWLWLLIEATFAQGDCIIIPNFKFLIQLSHYTLADNMER